MMVPCVLDTVRGHLRVQQRRRDPGGPTARFRRLFRGAHLPTCRPAAGCDAHCGCQPSLARGSRHCVASLLPGHRGRHPGCQRDLDSAGRGTNNGDSHEPQRAIACCGGHPLDYDCIADRVLLGGDTAGVVTPRLTRGHRRLPRLARLLDDATRRHLGSIPQGVVADGSGPVRSLSKSECDGAGTRYPFLERAPQA